MSRITLSTWTDRHGRFAWIETRIPGGARLNRALALAHLRRRHPRARNLRVAEQWHVPLSHRAFKVYFEAD